MVLKKTKKEQEAESEEIFKYYWERLDYYRWDEKLGWHIAAAKAHVDLKKWKEARKKR